MSTIVLGVVTAMLLVCSVLSNAFFLQLGSRLVRISGVTFRRAVWATIAISPPGLLYGTLSAWSKSSRPDLVGLQYLFLILTLGAIWAILVSLLAARFWQVIVAWLISFVLNFGVACLLVIAVVHPFLCEAFKTPTNSMAPTILGQHLEAPCPRCGSPAYASPGHDAAPSLETELMICSQERRSCVVTDPPRQEHAQDWFIVSKFLRPRRWDVIAFRLPKDPKAIHLQRLIGMPNETVVIREGAIWIDGQKQDLPESCRGCEYTTHLESWYGTVWGSEEHPARLGPDEYFVLGDFSERALDSRLWKEGAPGHAPYAIPENHIIGVVTHIYWPLKRWRVLR